MAGMFTHHGIVIDGITHMSPAEALAEIQQGALLLDIREDFMIAMKTFDLPEILYLPRSHFQSSLADLPRERPVIVADAVGLYSKEAVRFLQRQGFENIANLNGGISAWEEAGMPVTADPDHRWTGSCMCQLRPRKGP